jgi:sulfide:quinone oxidoreductase
MGLVNLWILNGTRTLEDSKVSLSKLEDKGIKFLCEEITNIDVVTRTVTIGKTSSVKLEYDYLVIALGVEFALDRVTGFSENGGTNLYNADQIPSLRKRLLSLRSGKIVICITSVPYKCPPAPYEASLLIHNMLLKNGSRENVSIDIYTPTPIARPVAGAEISQRVVNMLDDNNIRFHPLHKVKHVTNKGNITFENGENVDYGMLIGIPPHIVPTVVRNSRLVKQGQNFMHVDKYTLKTEYENVFAIGDVNEINVNGNIFIPKAGIFAEAQANVVSQIIIDEIESKSLPSPSRFDGKGFCFMEAGNQLAGYVAADFYSDKGPSASLEPSTRESYLKKIDFERGRLKEWF